MAVEIKTYRPVLYPGAWNYVWSRSVNLVPAGWTLVSGAQVYQPTQLSLGLRSLSSYDNAYHHALRIPTNIPNGTYDLQLLGGVDGGGRDDRERPRHEYAQLRPAER